MMGQLLVSTTHLRFDTTGNLHEEAEHGRKLRLLHLVFHNLCNAHDSHGCCHEDGDAWTIRHLNEYQPHDRSRASRM